MIMDSVKPHHILHIKGLEKFIPTFSDQTVVKSKYISARIYNLYNAILLPSTTNRPTNTNIIKGILYYNISIIGIFNWQLLSINQK